MIIMTLKICVIALWFLLYGYAHSALLDGTWEPYAAFGLFTILLVILFNMLRCEKENDLK